MISKKIYLIYYKNKLSHIIQHINRQNIVILFSYKKFDLEI